MKSNSDVYYLSCDAVRFVLVELVQLVQVRVRYIATVKASAVCLSCDAVYFELCARGAARTGACAMHSNCEVNINLFTCLSCDAVPFVLVERVYRVCAQQLSKRCCMVVDCCKEAVSPGLPVL